MASGDKKSDFVLCSVEGCEKKARRQSSPYCEAHYMRMYRNGTLDKKIEPKPHMHTHGYVLTPASGHPLARGSSHAYEHRVVYYDAHGDGPFSCHWCKKEVTWGNLHIDHIDDNRANNAIENLVPSCAFCNQQRGRHKAQQTWAKRTGITAFGKTKTLSQWSREYGISRASIQNRIKQGMAPEEAISTPRGKFGPKTKAHDCNHGKGNWDKTDWRPKAV